MRVCLLHMVSHYTPQELMLFSPSLHDMEYSSHIPQPISLGECSISGINYGYSTIETRDKLQDLVECFISNRVVVCTFRKESQQGRCGHNNIHQRFYTYLYISYSLKSDPTWSKPSSCATNISNASTIIDVIITSYPNKRFQYRLSSNIFSTNQRCGSYCTWIRTLSNNFLYQNCILHCKNLRYSPQNQHHCFHHRLRHQMSQIPSLRWHQWWR